MYPAEEIKRMREGVYKVKDEIQMEAVAVVGVERTLKYVVEVKIGGQGLRTDFGWCKEWLQWAKPMVILWRVPRRW